MRGYEVELERRTLTYSLWNQSTEPMNTQAWHPVTFGFASASQKNIQDIKVFIAPNHFICFNTSIFHLLYMC
jgi:hypothetical protein